MTDGAAQLPLFPLQTVLLPGGPLQLQVFEPRYLDMVGRCMRTGAPFGVVRILEGSEAGAVSAGLDLDVQHLLQSIFDGGRLRAARYRDRRLGSAGEDGVARVVVASGVSAGKGRERGFCSA